MPLVHERTFRVRHSECDGYEHLRPGNYLRLMQETAFDASAAAGYDTATYRAMGAHWLVRETHIDFLQPIRYGDVVTIRTWVMDFRRIRSQRAYGFRAAATGELLAKAVTDWVYLDAATGRPAPIPDEMRRGFFPEGPPSEAAPRERFPVVGEPVGGAFRLRRRVAWRDIDAMRHMNNAAYLFYMEDARVQALEAEGRTLDRMAPLPRRIEIEYRLPALMGDEIEISTWETGLDMGTRHFAIARLVDGALLAQAIGRWEWAEVASPWPL